MWGPAFFLSMANSIYDQLAAGLEQNSQIGGRSILYRGAVIPCSVLVGDQTTKLNVGGLEEVYTIHVKILRSDVPIGQWGEPHTNEVVTYPAVPVSGLIPQQYRIQDIVPEEFAYSLGLTDPTK